MAIGGNDIEFAVLVNALLAGSTGSLVYTQVPQKINDLKTKMANVDQFLRTNLTIPADRIFYMEYFDVIRNDLGQYPLVCPDFLFATSNDFQTADQVRIDLNNAVREIANTDCRNTKIINFMTF